MKPVIIIAIAFVLLIPVNVFAEESRPQQEGVYFQKDSEGNYREVWNFPDYTCQPDCKLTILLDKQPSSGEEYPRYQLGETVRMKIVLFDIEYFGNDAIKSLDLNIWGNTHVKDTMEIRPEIPLIYEYVIGDGFNIGEYKIFGIAGGMNQELFFTVEPSVEEPKLKICTAQYDPVCGISGETFSNRCVLESAGDIFDYEGGCVGTESELKRKILCGDGTIDVDGICQVAPIEEEKPVEKVDVQVEKPSKKSVNWFSSLFDWLGSLFQ